MINKFNINYVFMKYKFLALKYGLKTYQIKFIFSLILVQHHPR